MLLRKNSYIRQYIYSHTYFRDSKSLISYFISYPAWTWGDPHIKTMDGKEYTFNGLGEYLLARTISGDFRLQGRTAQFPGSSATQWSAFCVANSQSSVQVCHRYNLKQLSIILKFIITLPLEGEFMNTNLMCNTDMKLY